MSQELETTILDGLVVQQFPVVPIELPALPRKITKGAFQERLGVMNVFAIDTSTNPICVALRAYLGRLAYVDLDDPQTAQLLGMLVQAQQPAANPVFVGSGPITQELAQQVLSAPVQDKERP